MGLRKEHYYEHIELNKPMTEQNERGDKTDKDNNFRNITHNRQTESAVRSFDEEYRLKDLSVEARIFIVFAVLLLLAVSVIALSYLSLLIFGAFVVTLSAVAHMRIESHKTEKLLIAEELMAGGVGIMVIPFIWHYNFSMVHSYIAFLSIIASQLFIASPFVTWFIRKGRCTETVSCVCSEISEKTDSRSGKLYAPVWLYNVGDTEYVCTEKKYSGKLRNNVGDVKEIVVNPAIPDDILYISKRSLVIPVIAGLALEVIGIMFMFI